MRPRPRRAFASLVCVALALMWLVAAWSKLEAPYATYEFTTGIVGGGLPSKAVVTGQVLAETLLGGAMLFGLVRGLRISLAGLLCLTGLLLWVKEDAGGAVKCACFISIVESDVDGALVRNAVLCAVTALAALIDPRPSASKGSA